MGTMGFNEHFTNWIKRRKYEAPFSSVRVNGCNLQVHTPEHNEVSIVLFALILVFLMLSLMGMSSVKLQRRQ